MISWWIILLTNSLGPLLVFTRCKILSDVSNITSMFFFFFQHFPGSHFNLFIFNLCHFILIAYHQIIKIQSESLFVSID